MKDKAGTKTGSKTASTKTGTTTRTKRATAGTKVAGTSRAKRTAGAGTLTLIDAAPDRAFWVNHGPILHNLHDLRDALATRVSDAQVAHHMAAGRNDFATWVEEVLYDPQCAQALRRAKTRATALRAVETALKRYA